MDSRLEVLLECIFPEQNLDKAVSEELDLVTLGLNDTALDEFECMNQEVLKIIYESEELACVAEDEEVLVECGDSNTIEPDIMMEHPKETEPRKTSIFTTVPTQLSEDMNQESSIESLVEEQKVSELHNEPTELSQCITRHAVIDTEEPEQTTISNSLEIISSPKSFEPVISSHDISDDFVSRLSASNADIVKVSKLDEQIVEEPSRVSVNASQEVVTFRDVHLLKEPDPLHDNTTDDSKTIEEALVDRNRLIEEMLGKGIVVMGQRPVNKSPFDFSFSSTVLGDLFNETNIITPEEEEAILNAGKEKPKKGFMFFKKKSK